MISKSAFGIDIGTQTIKIAELQKRGSKVSLVNYVMWNDNLDEVIQEKSGKNVSSAQHIADIVSYMSTTAAMNIKEAYIAIPSYLAFSSIVEFPLMTVEELMRAVPLEAKQYIPVPIEDVQIDWINLGKNQKTGGLQILLMAIPNTVVAKYLKIAKLLGIEVKGFELDIFSQMRSTHLNNVSTCIIDVGARSGTISILDHTHQLLLTRSFDIGGNQITNKIADAKGVSVEESELLKKQYGLDGGDEVVTRVIGEVLGQFLVNDVSAMLAEYERSYNKIIEEVVIVGGISRMKGVKRFVEQKLYSIKSEYSAIKCAIGSPDEKIVVQDNQLQKVFRETIWQDLSLAIGIALREFN